MKPIRKLAALAVSASALLGVGLTGTAQAQTGFPVTNPHGCAAQVFIIGARGTVILKAGSRLSGSYAFVMNQDIRTSDLDIRLDGRFNGNGRTDTELARGQFELGHYDDEARPGRFTNELDSVRSDHNLNGLLEIYDHVGRVTCRTAVLQVLTARNPALSGGLASISADDGRLAPPRQVSPRPAPQPAPQAAPGRQPVPQTRPAARPTTGFGGYVRNPPRDCRYIARLGRRVCRSN